MLVLVASLLHYYEHNLVLEVALNIITLISSVQSCVDDTSLLLEMDQDNL